MYHIFVYVFPYFLLFLLHLMKRMLDKRFNNRIVCAYYKIRIRNFKFLAEFSDLSNSCQISAVIRYNRERLKKILWITALHTYICYIRNFAFGNSIAVETNILMLCFEVDLGFPLLKMGLCPELQIRWGTCL